ncbi:MAG: DUF1398 domain-containing protein [Flavobacteriaceae bacterium]
MFTLVQIQNAHSKVKSGADFPAYIQEIKSLGVTHYEAFVADGHVDYHHGNDGTVTVPAKYAPIEVVALPNLDVFKAELKAHQQGKTDYLTFIQMCATTGIEKWEICMDQMTCTYFDLAGNKVLVEQIPG